MSCVHKALFALFIYFIHNKTYQIHLGAHKRLIQTIIFMLSTKNVKFDVRFRSNLYEISNIELQICFKCLVI